MGIAPYKYFTFDGESSRNYDVYLTGTGVFNAPQRAVDLLEIPGRNGNYALDQGRFNNITVTYKAGIVDYSESDFADKVSAVRNWLCSKVGYVRLTDDYNPDEYRMAVFKNGITVDHDDLKTGEFEITFECKPQRWLTSGETPIEIGAWHDVQTLSGDIVQLNALETDKVKSLVADIDPVQDLHGYDAPWVGGAGKNKASVNELTNIGWAASNADLLASFNSLSAGTYTLSFDVKLTSVSKTGAWQDGIILINSNGNVIKQNNIATDPTVGFTDTVEYTFTLSASQVGAFTACYLYGCGSNGQGEMGKATLSNIQLESGNQKTSFAPYSNICPISGWNSVEVTVTDDLVDPTDTDTYTTSLGTTVYGGTVDVVSGELTVTHAGVDLGSLSWNYNSNWGGYGGAFYVSPALPNIKLPVDIYSECGAICSQYEEYTRETLRYSATYGFCIPQDGELSIRDYNYTDAPTFKTAMSGVYLVYPLATPTTYTLTAQQVDLLLGTNNIWADTGDVTLEYGQDPMVLINPTPFEAEPLLAVKGYGDINIGSNSINIASVPLGEIVIYGNEADYTALTRTVTLDVSRLNSADTIAVSCVFDTRIKTKGSMWYISNFATGTETDCSSYWVKTGSTQYDMFITPTGLDFAKGTSSTETCTLALTIGTNGTYYSRTITCSVAYDGDDTLTLSASIDSATPGINFYKYAKMQETTADSTMSALGNPMYIDLDIGEAWNEDSGEPVSVNNAVTLPSDLPKLPPGATAFTYDGTVTELKVTPRWWKV